MGSRFPFVRRLLPSRAGRAWEPTEAVDSTHPRRATARVAAIAARSSAALE